MLINGQSSYRRSKKNTQAGKLLLYWTMQGIIMDLLNIEWVNIRRDLQDGRATCILSILFILSINSGNAIPYLTTYPTIVILPTQC